MYGGEFWGDSSLCLYLMKTSSRGGFGKSEKFESAYGWIYLNEQRKIKYKWI